MYRVTVSEHALLYEHAGVDGLSKNEAYQWINDWLRAVLDYVCSNGRGFSGRVIRVAVALEKEARRSNANGQFEGAVYHPQRFLCQVAGMPGGTLEKQAENFSRALRALREEGFVVPLRSAVGGALIPAEKRQAQVLALALPKHVEARLRSYRGESYSQVALLESSNQSIGKNRQPSRQKMPNESSAHVEIEQSRLSESDRKRVGLRGAYSGSGTNNYQEQERTQEAFPEPEPNPFDDPPVPPWGDSSWGNEFGVQGGGWNA